MNEWYGALSRRTCRLMLCVLGTWLSGCSTLIDCNGAKDDTQKARIRSSEVRMLLAEPRAAYRRFAPYAAMSALVYKDAHIDKGPDWEEKAAGLRAYLDGLAWKSEDGVPGLPVTDDKDGMFFRVWSKSDSEFDDIVIVYRGTSDGMRDWVNGNLWWFTRYLPGDDQYKLSRASAKVVLDHFSRRAEQSGRKVRFHTAGHSLGGGLAQNVLYAFPEQILQAYAFNSSPVTGYSLSDAKQQREACHCLDADPGGEARVFRVYEKDEVLAWLRFPLKLVLPLNRQIVEVRFALGGKHSMMDLAKRFVDDTKDWHDDSSQPWWAGLRKEGAACENPTEFFQRSVVGRCALSNDRKVCPP